MTNYINNFYKYFTTVVQEANVVSGNEKIENKIHFRAVTCLSSPCKCFVEYV